MKISKLLPILVISLSLFLAACATSTSPSEAYKGETSSQIFQEGEASLRNKNYQDAIKHFEALDVQYPLARETEIAQLQLIYAYYMTNEYASAESAADIFIHSHPASPHVDYAYYLRGLSNYFQNLGIFERYFAVDLSARDLSQIKKAYADFSELITLFPNSAYASAAHQYMLYLRNLLAAHELNVAQYYYKREAYVAAANRASLVIRHYQGAPSMPDALVVMVKSYRHLHLVQEENDTLAVLHYNYPNVKID